MTTTRQQVYVLHFLDDDTMIYRERADAMARAEELARQAGIAGELTWRGDHLCFVEGDRITNYRVRARTLF